MENILEMSVECVGKEGVTMVTMHMFIEVLDVFFVYSDSRLSHRRLICNTDCLARICTSRDGFTQ